MRVQGATCLQIVFIKICPVRGHGSGARACSVLTAGGGGRARPAMRVPYLHTSLRMGPCLLCRWRV
jgi:hypothetical protein